MLTDAAFNAYFAIYVHRKFICIEFQGPLRMLVNIAEERDQNLNAAMIYSTHSPFRTS